MSRRAMCLQFSTCVSLFHSQLRLSGALLSHFPLPTCSRFVMEKTKVNQNDQKGWIRSLLRPTQRGKEWIDFAF